MSDDKMRRRPSFGQVYFELSRGKLDSLADYLRYSQGHIDPMIAKRLATLLDGSKRQTGFRLKLVKHPGIGSRAPGREEKWENIRLNKRIASFMGLNGGYEKGCYDAALHLTAEEFGIGITAVKFAWSKHKDNEMFRVSRIGLMKLRADKAKPK